VPKDWTHKIIRKVQASKEVWGKITGVIDTKEKFEAHRLEMAEREWARMKSVDSIECRNCHSFDAMSPDLQKKAPYKKHQEAKAAGQSCIDCHKGIAHKLPKGYKDPNADEE
jgi:cytochrome c-type protein NapC